VERRLKMKSEVLAADKRTLILLDESERFQFYGPQWKTPIMASYITVDPNGRTEVHGRSILRNGKAGGWRTWLTSAYWDGEIPGPIRRELLRHVEGEESL
jgi:hypothetical protein